jgi:hypothetical protein
MANGRIRILVIAPLIKELPELPGLPKEVMGFVNARSGESAYDVVLLQGSDVDESSIERAVKENQFDIWWIASHGDPTGIAVSKGRLTIDNLAPYVRTTRARLLVLHSCASIDLANQLMQDCSCDVIATITQLDDAMAARTAGMFAVNLLRSGNPRTAYELSKPGGNRNYVFISRYESSNRGQLDSNAGWGSSTTTPLPAPVTLLNENRILLLLDKQQTDITALLVNFATLNGRLSAVESDVREIRETLRPTRSSPIMTGTNWWLLIIMIGVLAVIALLLFLVGTR